MRTVMWTITLDSCNLLLKKTSYTIPLKVDTDESLLLESGHVHTYSWRMPRSIRTEPRLHVCVETEGDWRWSEPFELDTVGVCSLTIHHRLHSATLFIEVRALTGIQKQVGLVYLSLLLSFVLGQWEETQSSVRCIRDCRLQTNVLLRCVVGFWNPLLCIS